MFFMLLKKLNQASGKPLRRLKIGYPKTAILIGNMMIIHWILGQHDGSKQQIVGKSWVFQSSDIPFKYLKALCFIMPSWTRGRSEPQASALCL